MNEMIEQVELKLGKMVVTVPKGYAYDVERDNQPTDEGAHIRRMVVQAAQWYDTHGTPEMLRRLHITRDSEITMWWEQTWVDPKWLAHPEEAPFWAKT